MFFATTAPSMQSSQAAFRRNAYSPVGRSLERFLDEALQTSRHKAGSFEQDDTTFTLTFDVPGIAKDQLAIGIEGSVVRIESKEGAPRQYKAAYELPQEIDATASEAKLDNGVLTLKLVKVVPVSKVSSLTIQ
jgi:HSP20 family protein